MKMQRAYRGVVAIVVSLWVSLICPGTVLAQLTPTPLPPVSGSIAGAIEGTFDVNDFGAATYSIPLAAPPGSGGLAPALSLNYSSIIGNSFLGYGWTLGGLSAISRCQPVLSEEVLTNVINYDLYDRYCVDGQRTWAVSGTHTAAGAEYRTRSATFSRITAQGHSGPYGDSGPASFVAELKSGLRYEYGVTADARLESSGADGVMSWLLNKVSDRNGNYYTISYLRDVPNGEAVPLRIDYTGNVAAGLTPYNSVRFEYQMLAEPRTRYMGGQVYKTQRLLNSVKFYADQALQWEYRIQYDTNAVRNDDFIVSVQECDGSNVCLPETNFVWGDELPNSLGFAPGATLTDFGTAQGYVDNKQHPTFVGDWNGDGRTDIGRVLNQTAKFYISTPTGFQLYSQVTTPNLTFLGNQSDGEANPVAVGDWNGDGLTDFVRANFRSTQSLSIRYHFYVSTGSGFVTYGDFNVQEMAALGECTPDAAGNFGQILTADWNGDGRTDFARVTSTCNRFYRWMWQEATLRSEGFPINSSSPPCPLTECPYLVGDWNGDRLADVARVFPNNIIFYVTVQVLYNPFFYFYQISVINNFTMGQGYYPNVDAYPFVVGDWNGDGLTDIGRLGSGDITLCKALSQNYPAPPTAVLFGACQTTLFPSAPAYPNHTNYPLVTGDWNGDGVTDLARTHPDGVHMYHVKEGVPLERDFYHDLSNNHGYLSNNLNPLLVGDWDGDGQYDLARVGLTSVATRTHVRSETNFIKEIKTGFGAVTRIQYGLLTDPAVHTKTANGSYPSISFQGSIRVVTQVEVSDDASTSSYLAYRYKGLRYNLLAHEPVGFAEVETTNQITGNKKTVFFKADGLAFDGAPYKTETRLANGTLVHKTEDTWSSVVPGPDQIHSYISQSKTFEYELDGTLSTSTQTDYVVDTYGNTTQITVTRSDGSVETTQNTFANNEATWQLGQLTDSVVTRTGVTGQSIPPSVRRVMFQYQSGTGLLALEVIEPMSGQGRTKAYTYDVFGNMTSTTLGAFGVPTRSSSQTFDPRGRFAITKTNALGHTESATYHPGHGKPLTVTDANGLVTSYSYDGFGRQLLVTRPDQTQTRTLYLQPPVGAPINCNYVIRTDSSGMAPVTVCYDGLSREVLTANVGFQGQLVFTAKAYDDAGHLYLQSEPYELGEQPLWTGSNFDALGRVTDITEPGNRYTSFTYAAGGWTYSTNSLGQTTAKKVDDRGRLTAAIDADGKQVNYRYDPNGNLIWLQDSLGNITTAQFDMWGNKIALQDPDTGTSSYQYNGFGELISETNALQQVRSYSYDALGRKVQRTSPEGVESWVFDTALHGIGKLHRAVGLNGLVEAVTYDSFGRPTTLSRTINGKQYDSTTSYTNNGFVFESRYPSRFSIRRIYNQYGYLAELRRGDTSGLVWKATGRNSRGQATELRYGNGLKTTFGYRPEDGLLDSIQTGTLLPGAGATIQDLRFQFDDIGNLIERRDIARSLSETFQYDSLNRLTSAHVPGSVALTMTYNELGNIISRSDVGTYLYQSARPHAVTGIVGVRGNTYTYDAAGNRITSVGGSITYDSSGHPVVLTQGALRLEFSVNPEGERVEERSFKSGVLRSRKLYAGPDYEQTTAGSSVKREHFISVDGETVAIYTTHSSGTHSSSTMRYLHKDHLGSIQTITDEAGIPVEVLSFNSWGERRDAATWMPAVSTVRSSIDRGYTGHEQLDEVGLIHMNGRVYDPVAARFVSADPFIQTVSNQQSLNRYSYVQNNPLSFVDPSGYFLKGFFKKAARFIKKALPLIVAVTAAYFVGPMVTQFIAGQLSGLTVCTATSNGLSLGLVEGISAGAGAAAAGVASSTAGSLVSGGGLRDGFISGLKSAPLAFVSGFSANQIGTAFIGKSLLGKAVAHGAANGVIGRARGESFQSGFLSGLVSSLSERSGFEVSVLAGGTASAIAGGKFGDGAMSAALIHLYNFQGMHASAVSSAAGAAMAEQQYLASPEGQAWQANAALDYVDRLEFVGGFFESVGAYLSTRGDYLPSKTVPNLLVKGGVLVAGTAFSGVGDTLGRRAEHFRADLNRMGIVRPQPAARDPYWPTGTSPRTAWPACMTPGSAGSGGGAW